MSYIVRYILAINIDNGGKFPVFNNRAGSVRAVTRLMRRGLPNVAAIQPQQPPMALALLGFILARLTQALISMHHWNFSRHHNEPVARRCAFCGGVLDDCEQRRGEQSALRRTAIFADD